MQVVATDTDTDHWLILSRITKLADRVTAITAVKPCMQGANAYCMA